MFYLTFSHDLNSWMIRGIGDWYCIRVERARYWFDKGAILLDV